MKAVTLGEIMLRLSPSNYQKLNKCDSFDAVYGGAEANVAVALSNWGIPTSYVTRLPDNILGKAAQAALVEHQVNTEHVILGGKRLGIYFIDKGKATRTRNVIYDREGSAFTGIKPSMIDWDNILQNAQCLHWSGITPAISYSAAKTCDLAIKTANRLGIFVSADLNYRPQLWKYGKDPKEVLYPLLKRSNLIIADPLGSQQALELELDGVDLDSKNLNQRQSRAFAEKLHQTFPKAQFIAFTLRNVISATHQRIKAYFFDGIQLYKTNVIDIDPVVDRIGSGDAFAAGLIYGLLKLDHNNYQEILNFAMASCFYKHTLPGDFNTVEVEKIKSLASKIKKTKP